jgi:adenosine deaminase
LTDIQKQKRDSQHFYTTYYLNEKETRSNFHILYTLPPSKIEELKKDYIGIDRSKQEEELAYLQRLPKSDLHCHLGGVLSAEEMVEVAKCYLPLIEEEKKKNSLYGEWDCKYDKKMPIKIWYNELASRFGVHKGLIASRFILEYEENPKALEQMIFGSYTQESDYKSIGINAYESLGDLQGSALLCNEAAIRRIVQILLSKCKKEHVAYLEIRCSPINYQTSVLSPKQVLQAIFEELERELEVETSVVLIASRHGGDDKILQSIELVKQMKSEVLFKKYFRGFDLAGDESAKTPKEVREQFLEIMKDCYNITIHAGETAPAENIWEAVYHLTAERIGHGLKLIEKEDLMVKFLERGIGIEMCPSSNYQIVGYRDNYFSETQELPEYPLKKYLDCELKVSVNTDNAGISITTATQELHRAARLTRGGLSKWDLLQLTCNGFRTAFYPYEQKKQLIRRVEEKISELIKNDLL